jgi:integrase
MFMAIHKLGRSENKLHTLPDGAHGDGNNLWLLVRNGGGSKTWIFRWKNRFKDAEGKKRDRVISLGPLRIIAMEEARANAVNYCRMLRDGKDPEQERAERILNEQIAQGKARTVRQVAEEYEASKLKHMAKHTQRNGRRWLADINHAIGDMPIAKVDEQVVIEKLLLKDDLWVTNNPTATGIQHTLSAMFKLGISKGYVPRGHNPALWENISGSLPERRRVHKAKHHPGVQWKKMPEFMQDLFAYRHSGRLQCFKGVPPIVLWLALAALSGGRPGEARLAQWKEFDFDKMIWTIPTAHLKMGHTYDEDTPKRVPISSAMYAVLKLAMKIAYPRESSEWMDGHKRGKIFPKARHKPDTSPDALVFPNSVNAPFNEPEGARHMRNQLKKWLPAVPHGFRTSHKDSQESVFLFTKPSGKSAYFLCPAAQR